MAPPADSGATYATLSDLVKRAPYSDLAEVAAPDHSDVDGDLLARLLDGDELIDVLPATRAAAIAAQGRLQQALDDAAIEINSYIRTRYPSFDSPPDALTLYCTDIALWRLFGGDRDSERRSRYHAAQEWLRDVAAGRIDLEPQTTAPTTGARLKVSPAMFTRANLRDL